MSHRRLLASLVALMSLVFLSGYTNWSALATEPTSINLLTPTPTPMPTLTPTPTPTLTPTIESNPAPLVDTSQRNLPIVGILIGGTIGLGIGFLLGYSIFRSRGEKKTDKPTISDPSYMEVVSVLIGLRPDTRDYLGDMINALILSKIGTGNRMLNQQDLLSIMKGFLDQLNWKFGLAPVARVLSDGEVQLTAEYDSSRHITSRPPCPETPVEILEPGWQIRRGDGSIQIVKKARVKRIGLER